MTDTSADLVTKIDVLPDLDGLDSFDAAIDKAIAKVNQLDAAIKRVNNLKPASPYAPSGASAMPSATTTAAVAAITATGANLISRTPLADVIRRESKKIAEATTQGIGSGVAGILPMADRTFAGGGMAHPALPASAPAVLPPPIPAIGQAPAVIPAPAPASKPAALPASVAAPAVVPTATPAPTPAAVPVAAPKPAVITAAAPVVAGSGGGGGGGAKLPPAVSGAAGQPAGKPGGLWDPNAGNPFAKYDTSAKSFSGEPLETKKKPVAEGVERAAGGGFRFGMDNLLAGAGLAAGVVAGANAMADSMDTIQRQQAQIARLAQTTGDAKEAFFALNAAASDMRSDSGSFISTYTNMATATEKLGYSQERTIKATQGLVGALQLGGGSEQAKSAALYQMGQAFSSDRFGGDEFRSFMEAIGTMAPKVAEAFGTDVKGLRAMSEAGKLTADTMFKAFEKMAANNADLLKKQGWTWGQVTTVMKNDWQSFLAQATIGGEWQRFTDWAANTLIPVARGAEKEIAEFWSSLADESKTAILIGILGAVGTAFTALAIPVMAALWPFLAIGAAVWVVYEAFVEWKAWMNGEGGTIFESLFGSFDTFEKRYPAIMKLLRSLRDTAKDAGEFVVNSVTGNDSLDEQTKKKVNDFDQKEGVGGLDIVNKILSLFNGDTVFGNPNDIAKAGNGLLLSKQASGQYDPFTLEPLQQKGGTVVNNNTTNVTVDSPEKAADVVNNINEPGYINGSLGGNIAESTGAR
ncbi:tape measure protein [Enterobacter asburiae]|uniref:tape measure protein n=1 Tax=Enterobacter asburiae TaxID=61645 RepID=UPI00295324BE|nr:tape measure protein [Enterobacter asburiae]MDV7001854.1 tape measure protein [Enterobacter asburiae]